MLSEAERVEGFESLQRNDAESFFLQLNVHDRAGLVLALPPAERRLWMRLLAPDDAADLIQEAPANARAELLALLDEVTQREVKGLLDYAEDDAGGLMNTRYSRLRPDMILGEAISYLRRDAQTRQRTTFYAYVVDPEERLLGVITFRDSIIAPADKLIREVMRTEVISAAEDMDQGALSKLFMRHHLLMIPVVDSQGRIKGIVSVDDIVDVVQEESHRRYSQDRWRRVSRRAVRAGFSPAHDPQAGRLARRALSRDVDGHRDGIFRSGDRPRVILALFVPLIISSGGNSGSQSTTLVWRWARYVFATGGGWCVVNSPRG